MELNKLLLALVSHAKDLNGVSNHILLHLEVQRCICGKAGSVVDLDQPRLEFLINENVEAQDLKAHGVDVTRLVDVSPGILSLVGHLQIVLETRLNCAHRSNDELLDLVHHLIASFLAVIEVVLDPLKDGGERPLVATVAIVEILVENKFALVSGINRVIGQMHIHIVHVLLVWCLIGVSGEPREALLEQVDSKWVN